jgi:hypothetical protein
LDFSIVYAIISQAKEKLFERRRNGMMMRLKTGFSTTLNRVSGDAAFCHAFIRRVRYKDV